MRTNKAFTLIELIIVVLIIVILAAAIGTKLASGPVIRHADGIVFRHEGIPANWILGISTIAIVGCFLGWCWRQISVHGQRARTVVATNIGLLVVSIMVVRELFPAAASHVLYQGVVRHIFYLVPLAIGTLLLWLGIRSLDGMEEDLDSVRTRSSDRMHGSHYRHHNNALSVILCVAGIFTAILGCVSMESLNNWMICRHYRPTSTPELIPIDLHAIRFTPLAVAHKDMTQTFGLSDFQVEEELTTPVDVNGGFGFVAPLTPNGIINTFMAHNDGFMIYNDNPGVSEAKRAHRIHLPQAVGEHMEWTDNMWRTIYNNDLLCVYPDIAYIQLDPKQPDVYTAIAPRIVYEYAFPCFWIPVWDGDAIVDAQGTVTILTRVQALADPRLQGKRIVPEELARLMVEVQIYDQGFIGGWIRRNDKIEVPELPGGNQMPFFMKARDGKSYFVVSTEPDGPSFALFRTYYIDVSTGAFEVQQTDPGDNLLGPAKAIERVKSLSGYRWVERKASGDGGSTESGDFRIIEPVYITKRNNLYWKYTITTESYTGVVATVVVDARTKRPEKFERREQFEAWLESSDAVLDESTATAPMVSHSDGNRAQRLHEIRLALEKAMSELRALEQDAAK